MRMRTTRAGVDRLWLLVGACLLLAPLLMPAAQGRRKAASYALVAGTVFRENGASLPGAEIFLEALPEGSSKPKLKRLQAISDARGEFAFRVPPERARYRVVAKAGGYKVQEKLVSVQGEERIDVFFRLEPQNQP